MATVSFKDSENVLAQIVNASTPAKDDSRPVLNCVYQDCNYRTHANRRQRRHGMGGVGVIAK